MSLILDKMIKFRHRFIAMLKYYFFRWRKKNNNKKVIIIGASILVAVMIVLAIKLNSKKEYRADPAYCAINSDCVLYHCTNCGNNLWVEENNISDVKCTNKVPGLVGCECINNQCKRKYER